MDLEVLKKQREEILEEIKNRGYNSLRYSILDNQSTKREWENRIEFENGTYFVYATMDRASYNKKREFENFEDAKRRFFELLDLTVKISRRNVEKNKPTEYSSPLWSD